MHGEVTAMNDHHDHHDHHLEADATDVFGFWLYIMTDCILFATLFATFLVLNYTSVMPSNLKDHINLHVVLLETVCLLVSNFTFCLAVLSLYKEKTGRAIAWLGLTFLLGASFVAIEVNEFVDLAKEGFSWSLNAHASSFFTLVGTHGFHVSCGLIWILIMMIQLPLLKNKLHIATRRMTYLGLFWNFLDIVWIFVFTVVYLMGAL
jgi:cytochrome o ubiquinol oxidase subunit 3